MSRSRLPGARVPHWKGTAQMAPRRMPVPPEVAIPMSMNIGAPAKPVVKPGDEVKVGQLIAEAGGFVSSPIYASVSGKVKRIDEMLGSNGRFMPAVVITSDGEQTVYEGIAPPEVTDLQSFLAAVRDSGVVGLGGAGFPTAAKLTVKDNSLIKYIIVNGAECEPYVTSDTRTMLDDAPYVMKGVELLKKYLGDPKVIIGIEDNKPQCIKRFNELNTAGLAEIHPLPSLYPQGGEKVLIYNTTGRIVPEGGLPIDAGAIVINCTTLAFIAKYMETGMPLVEKVVTVDGSAVKTPDNVIVPIGTPMSAVFEFCGGFKSEPRKVFYGGPMMGIAVPTLDAPIMKNTNAIVALDDKDAHIPEPTACIRCGLCIDHCPLNLMPVEIHEAYEKRDGAMLETLKVNLCMECGCCSFVCPARLNHVQTHKLAKNVLRAYQAEQKAAAEKKKAAEEAKKEAAAK